MTVLGAAIAAGLLLAFYDPASGVPGISLPGSGGGARPGFAGGHASSTITIGYPPFAGITGSGSDSNPQAQAQAQSGGFGNTPRCCTGNSGLTVPPAITPASSGALITGTICGSPAATAGITGGAVITAVNGQAVSSPGALTGILSRFHPGDTVSVTWVSPSGQQSTSRLHLARRPRRRPRWRCPLRRAPTGGFRGWNSTGPPWVAGPCRCASAPRA